MDLYVIRGSVIACVIDTDLDEFTALRRGGELVDTIGAEVARDHDLRADWIRTLNRRNVPLPPPTKIGRLREHLKTIFGFQRDLRKPQR